MANVAEGFARRGSGEWSHALSLAQGSCAETKSHLYVALDCGYLAQETMAELYEDLEEIAKMLHALRTRAEKG